MFSYSWLLLLPVVLTLVRKYRENYTWGRYKCKKSLDGKVFIVTGCNSGIGKETARVLASKNAKVIMACRDITSARNAIVDIRKTTSSGMLIPIHLDLQSIESIKTFASTVLQIHKRIDVLINNAGVIIPPSMLGKTDDGFELHFGVNYLGHFILTKLLLERLKASAPSRIVNVTSTMANKGIIDVSNLNGEKGWPATTHLNQPYVNTKLELIYFTKELAKRLENDGVSAFAVCPGFCKTGLMRYIDLRWYHYVMFSVVAYWYLRSASHGAQTVLYCALEDDLCDKSGKIFRDFKEYQLKDVQLDDETGRKLWDATESLIVKSGKL